MKIKYIERKFQKRSLKKIDAINEILEEYNNKGYQMTVRQLYYQMVNRHLVSFDNNEYDKLITLVSNARNAGLIDWDHIIDRSRDPYMVPISESVELALQKAANNYHTDIWKDMPVRPIIWFEKAGITQIVAKVANKYNLEYMSSRGESSLTWLHNISQDHGSMILYLGDHDAHGVQISDGMAKKVELYSHGYTGFKRIGISLEQGAAIGAPRIPLKKGEKMKIINDNYEKKFGCRYGHEVDAMSPVQMAELIETEVQEFIDLAPETFEDNLEQQAEERELILAAVA